MNNTKAASPEPQYRVVFDAAQLLREHPPRFQNSHKKALFGMAYPPGTNPEGRLGVTRWASAHPETLDFAAITEVSLVPNFFDYQATFPPATEWHVNFADPRLFIAYGSGLFAQDEMQVAEHPLLGSIREALIAHNLQAQTTDGPKPTPILVTDVERRLAVETKPDISAGRPRGLYGNLFAAATLDVVRRATCRLDPPTRSNIIAIAAPAGGSGEYSEAQIESIFVTAFTGFLAAKLESEGRKGPLRDVVIHSGFWGCGAFGGNRKLMIAMQVLASRAAGINRLVLHAGDDAGVVDAQWGLDVADTLASRCGSPCKLATLVGRTAILGYRWGVSDGN